MRLHLSSGLALCCVVLAASLALPARQTGALTPANSRKPAPDFTLADSKGASRKLSGYKGRVVLLDFWATWCGGCKVEIPWYMEFQRSTSRAGSPPSAFPWMTMAGNR